MALDKVQAYTIAAGWLSSLPGLTGAISQARKADPETEARAIRESLFIAGMIVLAQAGALSLITGSAVPFWLGILIVGLLGFIYERELRQAPPSKE